MLSCSDSMCSLRNKVLRYAEDSYGCEPEYLWESDPDSGVLRHQINRKWFAVFMNISKSVFELGEGRIDIVDVKAKPDDIDRLILKNGFYRGYHMNKRHWLTIVLDGTIPFEEITTLLDRSYDLTLKL